MGATSSTSPRKKPPPRPGGKPTKKAKKEPELAPFIVNLEEPPSYSWSVIEVGITIGMTAGNCSDTSVSPKLENAQKFACTLAKHPRDYAPDVSNFLAKWFCLCRKIPESSSRLDGDFGIVQLTTSITVLTKFQWHCRIVSCKGMRYDNTP